MTLYILTIEYKILGPIDLPPHWLEVLDYVWDAFG